MTPADKRAALGNVYLAHLRATTTSFSLLERARDMSALEDPEESIRLFDEMKSDVQERKISFSQEVLEFLKDLKNSEWADDEGYWIEAYKNLAIILTHLHIDNGQADVHDSDALTAISKQIATMAAMNIYPLRMAYNLWNTGVQTFLMSEGLSERLMFTDVGHANIEDVKLPFDSFILQVPKGLAHLVDESTGHHDVDSIVVSRVNEKLQIMLAGAENENSTEMGDDSVFVTLLGLSGTIDSSIASEGKVHAGSIDNVYCMGEEGLDAYRKILLYTFACILYITDFPKDRAVYLEDEIKAAEETVGKNAGKKKKNAKANLRKLRRRSSSTVVIGSGVKPEGFGKSKHGTHSVNVSSYVRGHRKMQPYGLMLLYRKPIWVNPYWRNVDKERSSKRYHVI